ncbi:MAG: DUF3098 domain-containing protein [Bacteroidota bacterium]
MAKKYKQVPKKKAAKSKKVVKTTEENLQAADASTRKVVSTTKSQTTTKANTNRVRKSRAKKATEEVLPFGKMNYILLLIGIAIIGLGFFLLSLDDFVDATEFSVSLYIAPIVIVAGFIEIIYAIMYKDKSQTPASTTEA